MLKTSSGKGGDRGSGLFRNDLAASGENFFFLPIIDGRRRRRKFDQICWWIAADLSWLLNRNCKMLIIWEFFREIKILICKSRKYVQLSSFVSYLGIIWNLNLWIEHRPHPPFRKFRLIKVIYFYARQKLVVNYSAVTFTKTNWRRNSAKIFFWY